MTQQTQKIISAALNAGQDTLNEYQGKLLLAEYGIPVTREDLVHTADEAASALERLGAPVVLKSCGQELKHKTEAGLVALGLDDADAVRETFDDIMARAASFNPDGVLVQSMISGGRELLLGMKRTPGFGPCVTLGIGGIFTETLRDVAVRVAPFEMSDALDMMEQLRTKELLGPVRGMAPADRNTLAEAVMSLGRLALECPAVSEIDINPIIIQPDGAPVAVDALVILDRTGGTA